MGAFVVGLGGLCGGYGGLFISMFCGFGCVI